MLLTLLEVQDLAVMILSWSAWKVLIRTVAHRFGIQFSLAWKRIPLRKQTPIQSKPGLRRPGVCGATPPCLSAGKTAAGETVGRWGSYARDSCQNWSVGRLLDSPWCSKRSSLLLLLDFPWCLKRQRSQGWICVLASLLIIWNGRLFLPIGAVK